MNEKYQQANVYEGSMKATISDKESRALNTPGAPSEIHRELSRLQSIVSEARNHLDELESMLSPILRPETESKVATPTRLEQSTSTPLGDSISSMRRSMENMIDRFISIKDRREI